MIVSSRRRLYGCGKRRPSPVYHKPHSPDDNETILARISHTLPAAAADAPASTTFLAAAPPATCFEHDSTAPWSKPRADKHLRILTTKVCEICGLVSTRTGQVQIIIAPPCGGAD